MQSNILSAFGAFVCPEVTSVSQTYGTAHITFPRVRIPTQPCQNAFLVAAKVQDILELVVFSKKHEPGSLILCGLKFRYNDLSEVLLGEDCDEHQTLSLSHPIRSICVYHIQCYGTMKLVTGLRFSTGLGDVKVGNCDSKTKDILQIDQVRRTQHFKRLANHCTASLTAVLVL